MHASLRTGQPIAARASRLPERLLHVGQPTAAALLSKLDAMADLGGFNYALQDHLNHPSRLHNAENLALRRCAVLLELIDIR